MLEELLQVHIPKCLEKILLGRMRLGLAAVIQLACQLVLSVTMCILWRPLFRHGKTVVLAANLCRFLQSLTLQAVRYSNSILAPVKLQRYLCHQGILPSRLRPHGYSQGYRQQFTR